MSSPLRLTLAVLSTIAALAAASGAAASSSSASDDARATAQAFVDALAHRDAARVCALFSSDALAKVGGQDSCLRSMSADDTENDQDYQALDVLESAYTAARLSATKRKGRFVTKKFGARKLAGDMEQLDSDLTVKLGRSWAAAKGQLATTIILDTRSTARRLVLYAESDDGSIFRLSAAPTGRPSYDEVGTGIPETSPPASTNGSSAGFTATIDSVTMDAAGTAFVRGSLAVAEEDVTFRYGILIVLVPVSGAYYVDDLFYSTFTSGPDTGG